MFNGTAGVTVLYDGSGIVCGYESDTIIHVHSSGKMKLKTLATLNGGILSPCLIYCYKKTRTLVVGQYTEYMLIMKLH